MMNKPWKTTPVENIKKDGNPSFLGFLLLRAEFSLHWMDHCKSSGKGFWVLATGAEGIQHFSTFLTVPRCSR